MADRFADILARPLAEQAEAVLRTHDAQDKTDLALAISEAWLGSETPLAIGHANPPDAPARPEAPELLSPRDVPRRRAGTPEGRIALIHAIAHIELNAVDLHFDIIARFTHIDFPMGYYNDWVKAAGEEAKHFQLLNAALKRMGSHYGALPAHAGMWRAAEDTATDILGRLAIVPMVLEARGLDVTPGMMRYFEAKEDAPTKAALETIYEEEVGHVAYGSKWFHFLCGRDNLDPKPTFHALVQKYFHGGLKPPFNTEKRAEAGIPPDFYWPLIEDD